MKPAIDGFQGQVAGYFRALILAMSYLKIGGATLAKANSNDSVDVLLDEDIRSEPFKVAELLPHTAGVEVEILELYQGKIISAWADLLITLFARCVRAHFDGVRKYPQLKRRTGRIDFADNSDLRAQIEQTLRAEFAFEAYADRIRTINAALNPDAKYSDLLETIRVHTQVRNAVQHHGSKLTPQILKDLGTAKISLLNAVAKPTTFSVNDRITLSVPEIDNLKRAVFRVSNEWRLHA